MATAQAADAEAPADDAGRFFQAAQRAYDEGRYVDAAHGFEQAFKIKAHPAPLINAGDAWDKAGEYALAARAGLAGNIDNEFTRIAADRLQAYGEERIAECLVSEQANIPDLEAARPGEFARSPAGQVQSIPPGVSPPALVSED